VAACVLRWAFDLPRPGVSTTSIEGRIDVGRRVLLVGRERRRCSAGRSGRGSGQEQCDWLTGGGEGGEGGGASLRWSGSGMDAGRWMLERLNSSWLPGFLASWLPGSSSSHPIVPPFLKGHHGPPRPTSDQAPLHRPHCPRTCWERTWCSRPWNRGKLGLPVHWLISGRGFLQVWVIGPGDCAGVPDLPPGFTSAPQWSARIPCRSSSTVSTGPSPPCNHT
jgi:hypothetical protein